MHKVHSMRRDLFFVGTVHNRLPKPVAAPDDFTACVCVYRPRVSGKSVNRQVLFGEIDAAEFLRRILCTAVVRTRGSSRDAL